MIGEGKGQITKQIELSGATPVCTIVDGYDPVGNRLTRNLDGNPITWSYDDLYRLTGQQKAGQVCTYTLDGVGNLKTMWEGGNFPKTFTFNAADRLVTMVEGASLTTYAWTGYGALESEITGNSTTGYAYNGQDQLAVATAPDGSKTTYSFDGDGLRRSVATTNQSQDPPTLDITTMVWDGSDYLLLNEPTQNRVVLTLDSEIVACGSKDLLTDPLGSLVKEVSSGASLGSTIEIYPYGTLVGTGAKPSTPFVYVAAYGYYRDADDRDYVRARELMKKTARWMQVDEMWPPQKPFTYAEDRPLLVIDPSGMMTCEQCCAAFKGTVGPNTVGIAICCYGVKCPCVVGNGKKHNQFIQNCIKEHEMHHFGDIECNDCTKIYRPPFKDQTTTNKRECFAYIVGIRCLQRTCLDRNVIDNDTLECQEFLCGQCAILATKCKPAGIPVPQDVKDICKGCGVSL